MVRVKLEIEFANSQDRCVLTETLDYSNGERDVIVTPFSAVPECFRYVAVNCAGIADDIEFADDYRRFGRPWGE